jgi:hypothetical protein
MYIELISCQRAHACTVSVYVHNTVHCTPARLVRIRSRWSITCHCQFPNCALRGSSEVMQCGRSPACRRTYERPSLAFKQHECTNALGFSMVTRSCAFLINLEMMLFAHLAPCSECCANSHNSCEASSSTPYMSRVCFQLATSNVSVSHGRTTRHGCGALLFGGCPVFFAPPIGCIDVNPIHAGGNPIGCVGVNLTYGVMLLDVACLFLGGGATTSSSGSASLWWCHLRNRTPSQWGRRHPIAPR